MTGSLTDSGARQAKPPDTPHPAFPRSFWAAWACVAVICVLLSNIVELRASVEGEHPPFHIRLLEAILLEAGIAVFIAVFVSLTIETIARKRAHTEDESRKQQIDAMYTTWLQQAETHRVRLLNDVEKDVFDHLLGLIVPPSVLKELMDTIFTAKFIRRSVRIRYSFSKAPGNIRVRGAAEQLLLVHVTVNYTLKNQTREEEPARLHHYFENVIEPEAHADRYTSFEIMCGDTRIVIDDQDFTTTGFAQGVHTIRDGVQVYREGIRRGIIVDEVRVPPRGEVQVRYTYEVIRRISDSESYFVTVPVEDGIEIQAAVTDRELVDLQFWPDAAHRLPLRDTGSLDRMTRMQSWGTSAAFLPFQGIAMYWGPQHTPSIEVQAETKLEEPGSA